MSRLPIPGADDGNWGAILNNYLAQSHTTDGSLKTGVVGADQLQAGAVQASNIASGSVTKSSVGLGNVDNTSDANKPISLAAQTALAAKLATADLDTQTAAKLNDSSSATRVALAAQIAGLQGPQGVAGPANVLSVGTVATGLAGSVAAVTVTGTSPTQQLNLTIPRGDVGVTGAIGPTGDLGAAVDLGTTSGALDLSSYTLNTQTFRAILNGNLTLAPTGMPVVPAGKTGSFSLQLTQDATGSRTLTLDAAIKKAYGNPPALSTAASSADLLTFMWTGSMWIAALTAPGLA